MCVTPFTYVLFHLHCQENWIEKLLDDSFGSFSPQEKKKDFLKNGSLLYGRKKSLLNVGEPSHVLGSWIEKKCNNEDTG